MTRRLPLLAGALWLVPELARSEENAFSLERLRLANDRNGVIDAEWGDVLPHLAWDVGLWVGAEQAPLVLYDMQTGEDTGRLVDMRSGGSLMAAFGIGGFAQIGAEVPLVLYQDREAGASMMTGDLDSLSSFGVGDVRLVPKLRLGRGVAVQAGIDLPSGRGDYKGGTSWLISPELAVSSGPGAWRLAVNGGYRMRDDSRFLNNTIEDELTGRIGVGYRFHEADADNPPLELGVALSGATSAENPLENRNQNALESNAMATYSVTPQILGFAGGGMGLNEGFGTPEWRGFVGVRFDAGGEKEERLAGGADRDRDGFLDEIDGCPDDAEDGDEFQDTDGCPDVDNDEDGVRDSADDCPLVPGLVRLSGCPGGDSDEDGIADHLDDCVNEPEDKDGFEDANGCPDPDNDGDRVLDVDDRCPNLAGVLAAAGCPDPDRDSDSVPDRVDNCPDEPGDVEHAGCQVKQLVALTEGGIEILDAVYFKTGSDILSPRSFPLLDNVAQVILVHPELGAVLVEGHTDDVGDDERNMDLSLRRAESVRLYLMARGVPGNRLDAQGYGESRPLLPNRNKKNRAENRRVMFVIEQPNGSIEIKPSGAQSDTIDR